MAEAQVLGGRIGAAMRWNPEAVPELQQADRVRKAIAILREINTSRTHAAMVGD